MFGAAGTRRGRMTEPSRTCGDTARKPVRNELHIGASKMANEPRAGRNTYADIAPALGEYTDKVLFGEVWERPGLSKRDRSLITVATLVALYRTNELPFHLK